MVVLIQKTNGLISLDSFPKEKIKDWFLSQERGTSLFLIAGGVSLIVIFVVVIYRYPGIADTIKRSVYKTIFWNGIIRPYLTVSLSLYISSLPAIK